MTPWCEIGYLPYFFPANKDDKFDNDVLAKIVTFLALLACLLACSATSETTARRENPGIRTRVPVPFASRKHWSVIPELT